MSFSLKRELEFYINDIDSTDGVTKLAILPEFELKLEANLIQVYRKIIGEDPEMLPRSAVDQISPISIGFMTYLKPSMLDNKIGVTAPEKLLYDSLGGIPGFRSTEYYKVQFGRVNRLLPLYIFLKTTTAVYKINLAYIDTLEISFDIDYLLIGKWTAQAISLDILDIEDVQFTNVKDYSNIQNYIKSKFTVTTITDYINGEKEYKFPITKSSIKIINTLLPVYDKNIKVVTGTVKDLIVGGRVVSGELSAYLSSRIDYSKDFLINLYNDLSTVNRKFKVKYSVTDGEKTVEIILPKAILNIPTLDFQDVLNVNIDFTSSESSYGLNDDISYKYYYNTSVVFTYRDYILKDLRPEFYYTFEELGTTLNNHGTTGSTFNIVVTGGQANPTVNLTGKYLNSKAWAINSTYLSTPAPGVKPYTHKIFISFWYNPVTPNANESFMLYLADFIDVNFSMSRSGSINGGGYRGISVNISSSSYKFDIPTIGTWYLFSSYIDLINNKLIFYSNNVKLFDTTFIRGGNTGDTIAIGWQGANGIVGSKFSEYIISHHVSEEEVPALVNRLYNITDINEIIPDAKYSYDYSDYTDELISYPSFNEDYMKAVKLFNPKAHWRFNDNDSNKVRDHITGAYPLTLSNRPELRLDGPLTNDRESKAIWFSKFPNETLQYTTSSAPISTTGITKNTYIFWVYIDNDFLIDNNYRQCLIKTGSNSGSVLTLLHRIGGTYQFMYNTYIYDGETYYRYNVGYGDGAYNCCYPFSEYFGIRLQRWTCIAITSNKTTNTLKVYVDGILTSTTINSNVSAYWPSTIALEVGKRTYSPRSTFKLSEFSYFEKELSETSIQGIYAASGIRGFNINITPNKLNIQINSYTPTILRGQEIKAISSSINLTGKVSSVRNVKNICPQIGNNLIFEYWDPILEKYENVPIVTVNFKNTCITGTNNISGNNPGVLRYYGVNPESSGINISGNISNLKYITNVINSTIGIVGRIPSISSFVSIDVQSSSINISGYSPTIGVVGGYEPLEPEKIMLVFLP
jgi:hypothetical protein